MKIKIISTFALVCYSLSAFGWGQKGHDVTAAIAERHLSAAAKAQIDSLLDGKSIVYWSNWLDNASHTPQYSYSKTWHYKNIDADETFYNARLEQKGDIVTAITEQSEILADTLTSKESRALALKMIVHLLGDVHQPMHLGHRSDLGGNKWVVKYFKSPTNLHKIWDSNLVETAHKWSYTEWADQIDRLSESDIAEIISTTSPRDWAKETYEIAKEIYSTTPQNTNIEYNYIADHTPLIEEQFIKGGIRLANLLNSIFQSCPNQ